MTFKLEPVDVCVNINDRRDPASSLKRWAMGSPYDHVFVNLGPMSLLVGPTIYTLPMLFESDGNGVIIEPLARRYGQMVAVMRLKAEFDRRRILYIIDEAVKLAQDPQAQYVLLRLLFQKLGLSVPLEYHRDQMMICSEAAFEIFYRAGLDFILRANCVPPMPGDFVSDSPLLEEVYRGILSSDWV